MARNIEVQFGLLSFPGKADKAKETKESMSNMCKGQPDKPEHDPLPIKQPYTCTSCGPVTDYDSLVKGIKRGSTYAIVEQGDVADAKDTYTKEYKDVINLVPVPSADFLAATGPGDTADYLIPATAAGANHYQLLARLIAAHPELSFVGLHTPRSATSLYQVTVREGVLIMEKRTRSQDLKEAPSVGGEVNEALFAALDGMLESLVTEFDPDAYEDKYQMALDQMADAAEVVSVDSKKPEKATGVVTDAELMEKLRALKVAS